ncbi:MIP/aquaporin family protein [Deinococcus maricopensis]|uniref:Major intrinsic protein n=1 Tax=Deinococcus maricopensis (strain DSM 21211 / LMG 22137 / NRRL B-23946 / LB-34) TaxID=709986 RepID=E8U659_DEIML|nr:MIP/aquaporin family protein [Deinococcus maricopensis]ADV66548.1 major intrinsic protein [Deinococcus maricopensis DSM 21211]
MSDATMQRAPTHADRAAVPLARRLLAESLGTALLTLGGVGAGALVRAGLLPDVVAHTLPPALIVLGVIYTFGDVSGAHINPAVTLAFAARGSFPWRRVLPYWAAQLLGAVLAALTLRAVWTLPHETERVPPVGALLLDGGAALWLALVIVGTAKRTGKLGPNVGIPVACTVGLCHFLTNAVSAVAMNPARSLGPALVSGDAARAWPHVLGPLLGMLVGVALTWALRGGMNDDERKAARGDGQAVDDADA